MTVLDGLLCALAAAFFATAGLRAVDPGVMRRLRRVPTPPQQRLLGAAGPAFQPLDLGEAPMRWPSELPAAAPRFPEMPWPSETWTDDFFGRKGGAPVSFPATSATVAPSSSGKTSSKQPSAAERARQKAEAKKGRKDEPRVLHTPAHADGGVPSAEEVLAWVDAGGLADAVEKIRARTGWDFSKAAKHLSQIMRDRQ